MKKKILSLIGAIAIIVLMVFNIQFTNNTNNGSSTLSSLVKQAFASGGESGPYCYAGGRGASQCSINAGISIAGYGVSTGCSVTCLPGNYACCSIRCTCVPL